MATKHFVILFHARSGSSWLRSALSMNSNFELDYEPLSKILLPYEQYNYVNKFFTDQRDPTIDVVGFKVEQQQIADKLQFLELLIELDISVVVLTRSNIVKCSISQIRRGELSALTHKKYGIGQTNLRNEYDRPPKSYISSGQLKHQMKGDLVARSNVELLCKLISTPVLRLTYEDLLKDFSKCCDSLEEFLGVPIDNRGKYRPLKNTPDDIAQAIDNYEEIVEFLVNTPYEDSI